MNVLALERDVSCSPGADGLCEFCGNKVTVSRDKTGITKCPAREVPAWVPEYVRTELHANGVDTFLRPLRTAPVRPSQMLLGDLTEYYFSQIGITKSRYKAFKKILGAVPDCWCDARREWLNRAHVAWLKEEAKWSSKLLRFLSSVLEKGKRLWPV